MKKFSVYSNGSELIAVKQGWSWPGFFFHGIWALTKGLYVQGGIAFAIIIAVLAVAPNAGPVGLIIGCLFGSNGNAWWSKRLEARGFAHATFVQAPNPVSAIMLAQQNRSAALNATPPTSV